ncbi:MAG: hypothetical protein LBR42_00330 [Candidatus Methanoplasma sp.]|jgi:hypothetical protein|nr:hypothetical protein [Candidatus Methanoplasma sp.]
MTVTILSLIWALIALALGLYLALGVDSIINNFMSIPEIWDLMLETYTEESLRSALIIEGSVLAVSGGLALVTAILSLKKRLYIIALITCILSSIFGLVMLVGFIGFIVAYLIYKAKDEFVDNKPTL